MSSIRKKSDFLYLREHGVRKRTGMLTLVLCPTGQNSQPLTCVVAGKRSVGNAVMRNRAKRRIRALIREYHSLLSKGDLLMVVTKKDVCMAPYINLKNEYLYALKKVKKRLDNDK